MTGSACKNFFRTIFGSIGRFLSILIISLLGALILAGVGSIGPDMKNTVDAVYDRANLMDIDVVGTQGVTESDLAAILRINGVIDAEPSYAMDLICAQNGREYIINAMSIPERINRYSIVEGREPASPDECLVDVEFVEATGYDINSTITLTNGYNINPFQKLTNNNYTIVGTVTSALYLNSDRGTSRIGDGKVAAYVYLPKESFEADSYSAIYVKVDGAKELNSFSGEYEEKIDSVIEGIKEIEGERCRIRYADVKKRTDDYLNRMDEEYSEKKSNAQKQLDEAYNKLREADQAIIDGRKEITDKEEEIENAEKAIEEIAGPMAEAKAYIENAKKQVDEAEKAYETSMFQLDNMRANIEREKKALDRLPEGDEKSGKQVTIAIAERAADNLENQLESAKEQIAQARKELSAKEKEFLDYEVALETTKTALVDAKSQIEIAKTKLEEAESELEFQKQEYSAARKEVEEGLNDAEKQIANNREYIQNMTSTDWYVMNREDAISSAGSLSSDIKSLETIATYFPIFFFIVATLVALTTMTRMVEEERTYIGTVKALGYGKFSIAMKYIMYAFLASALGSVSGFFLGGKWIPQVVLEAYRTSYTGIGKPIVDYDVILGVIACSVTVACVCIATVFACRKTLKSSAAELMRPAAPKPGKRILLERIPFIWLRLSFNRKASVRNLLRYKKRFFMTILGVGGCTALLLVAFGIGDSVRTMSNKQYNEIFNYDFALGYEDSVDRLQRRKLSNDIRENINGIEDEIQVYRSAGYFESAAGGYSGQVIVPDNADHFKDFVKFIKTKNGGDMELGTDGVIITEKLAELLKLGVGDEITVKTSENDDNPRTFEVAGITENYVLHYVYIAPELYESVYNISVPYNCMYVQANVKDQSMFISLLMQIDGVSTATTVASEKEVVDNMTKDLNSVVVIIIVAAALLAFIVLYNLNNININERRRELATIKLLGFYNKELAAYIYRENIWLTCIGVALGIAGGIFLHRFIMQTAESEMIMLGRQLHWISYVLSIAVSISFSVLVNLVMYRKFKKIDMVESLKSVE